MSSEGRKGPGLRQTGWGRHNVSIGLFMGFVTWLNQMVCYTEPSVKWSLETFEKWQALSEMSWQLIGWTICLQMEPPRIVGWSLTGRCLSDCNEWIYPPASSQKLQSIRTANHTTERRTRTSQQPWKAFRASVKTFLRFWMVYLETWRDVGTLLAVLVEVTVKVWI